LAGHFSIVVPLSTHGVRARRGHLPPQFPPFPRRDEPHRRSVRHLSGQS